VTGLSNITGGDNRFYNNIFVGANKAPPSKPDAKSNWRGKNFSHGLGIYDSSGFSIHAGGNVYLNKAMPSKDEAGPLVIAEPVGPPRVENLAGRVQFGFSLPAALKNAVTETVTSELLGRTRIPNLPYEDRDGKPLKVDTDFFAKPRDSTPTPGPFENPGSAPEYLTEPSGKLVNLRKP
jgi:hypothetical protein